MRFPVIPPTIKNKPSMQKWYTNIDSDSTLENYARRGAGAARLGAGCRPNRGGHRRPPPPWGQGGREGGLHWNGDT